MPAPKTEATKRVVTKPKPVVPCIPDPALLFRNGTPPILRRNRLALEGNPPDENTLVESSTWPDTSSNSEHASDDEALNGQALQTLYEGRLQADSDLHSQVRKISLYEEIIASIIIFLARVDGFCGHPLQKLRAFSWPGEGR